MSAALHLTALGVAFEVRGLPAADRPRMAELWGPLVTTQPPVGGVAVQVRAGGAGWVAEALGRRWALSGPESAVAAASAAVNVTAADRTPLVAVHAAVLSRGGRTVVLPGASGSGKSTAAVVLCRAGWSYVSDEALALTDDGRVVPYPRPVALSTWTARRLHLDVPTDGATEHLLSAQQLGSDLDHHPAVPSTVVLSGGAAPSDPGLHRMTGLAELVRRSFTRHRDPVRTLRVLAVLVRGAGVVEVAGAGPVERALALPDLLAAATETGPR